MKQNDLKTVNLDKQNLTPEEASLFLGKSIKTIYSYTHKRTIAFFKSATGQVYFSKDDLVKFQEHHRIPSITEMDNLTNNA